MPTSSWQSISPEISSHTPTSFFTYVFGQVDRGGTWMQLRRLYQPSLVKIRWVDSSVDVLKSCFLSLNWLPGCFCQLSKLTTKGRLFFLFFDIWKGLKRYTLYLFQIYFWKKPLQLVESLNRHHVGVPVYEFLAGSFCRVFRDHVLCVLWHGCCPALDHWASSCPSCGPVLWAGSCYPHPVHWPHQRRPHQPCRHLCLSCWLTDVSFPRHFLHCCPVPGCCSRGCCAVRGHTWQYERQHGYEHGKDSRWMLQK